MRQLNPLLPAPLRVLAAVAAALALLLPAAPAAAHDGKVKLAVAGDGATGVTVRATYADGHSLDRMLRLVLNASGEGGRTVGPIQLNPAGEGQGFYASGPVLSPGRWQVTVAAPAPESTEVMVVVEARAAQAAPPAVPRRTPEEPAAGGAQRMWWVAGAALAIALLAGALLAVRSRSGAGAR